MTDEIKAKPTITKGDLSKLNTLLFEALDIARKQEELKRKDAENRAAILELVGSFVPDDAESGGEVFDGVTVKVETSTKFNKVDALNWAIEPGQLASAAELLTITSGFMPTAIKLLTEAGHNPGLAFDLNATGYGNMLKRGVMTGCPSFTLDRKKSLSLKTAAVKTGAELTALFEVVDDPEPAPEATTEAAV